MIEVRKIKRGDLIILSNGEEEIALGLIDYDSGFDRYRVEYRNYVTGWIGEEKHCTWWYEKDGQFAGKNTRNVKSADIVKVIHNESLQAEG